MPSRADILGHHAIIEGRLIVRAAEGEIWTTHGSRAEHLDKRTGYGRVHVAQRRPQSLAMAHRLIWIAAHGLIPNGLQVNHINSRRWDNRLANLELVTPKGNSHHAHRLPYDAIGKDVPPEWLSDPQRPEKQPEAEAGVVDLMTEAPRRRVAFEAVWSRFN